MIVLVHCRPSNWYVATHHIIQVNTRHSHHGFDIMFPFNVSCDPFVPCFHFTRVWHFNVSYWWELNIYLHDGTGWIWCSVYGRNNCKATSLAILHHTSACNLCCWIATKRASLFGTKIWSCAELQVWNAVDDAFWKKLWRVLHMGGHFWRSILYDAKHHKNQYIKK